MSKAISLALVMAMGLLFTAPALAAAPMHVRVHAGTTTVSHAGTTYHITAHGHGFMVTRQTAHGMMPVTVNYHNPAGHNLIYVRNGCIVYIDYNTGAWTGYYYRVC